MSIQRACDTCGVTLPEGGIQLIPLGVTNGDWFEPVDVCSWWCLRSYANARCPVDEWTLPGVDSEQANLERRAEHSERRAHGKRITMDRRRTPTDLLIETLVDELNSHGHEKNT